MDQQQARKEEKLKMTETNTKQFLAAARSSFFELMPTQPLLASIPTRSIR